MLSKYQTSAYIYAQEFKEKALHQYDTGESARQIYEDARFNLKEISEYNDYASKALGK